MKTKKFETEDREQRPFAMTETCYRTWLEQGLIAADNGDEARVQLCRKMAGSFFRRDNANAVS